MSRFCHDDALDAMLQYIIDNSDRAILCSSAPTTFAEANATYALADVAVVGGDFSIDNGASGGRRCTIAAKAGVTVDTAGTGNWMALVDDVNSKLLYVTPVAAVVVAVGIPADFGTWNFTVGDPVAPV